MDLRPYQEATVESLRQLVREGKRRLLCISPTGSGKTVTFCHVVQSAVGRGSRALIIAHRRELVGQASQKLNAFGVPHGIIQAGFPMSLHRPVQVASIQSLLARPGVLNRVDLVVIDECHHVTASNGYSKVLERYPNALVLGVTATPWRLDGHGLADIFDSHVVSTTPRELRDQGYLVPVGGWEYEGIDTSEARVKGGDFVPGDLTASATSRRVVGDIVAEWVAHAAGKRTVLFAVSIEQSRIMSAEFRKLGVPAEHVDGEMPTSERAAVLARLRSGETLVVSNCNVLTEGFDLPDLEVCILARPTLSTSLYLQMVGRVLRPAAGKAMARIHDHAGCLAAHGHPYAERDYNPSCSARANRKDTEKRTAPEKRCASCKSVIAAWPCDACGYAPDPKELQLELDPAAAKREIGNDGVAPKRNTETDAERKDKWKRRYQFDEDGSDRRAFFRKMVDRHGFEKGSRVYRWVSGFSERPRSEWVNEVLHPHGSAA
jgi:DNA repair protein RadD